MAGSDGLALELGRTIPLAGHYRLSLGGEATIGLICSSVKAFLPARPVLNKDGSVGTE